MENMEVSIFERLWENTFSRDLATMKSSWDARAEDYNENVIKKADKRKDDLNAVEFLISKDAIKKGDDVLDIGCGPGKYSMKFAEIANTVTAVDISPNMLKYAKENVENAGFNNVTFKNTPWQTFDVKEAGWDKKFDLVFASMTPAINCKESLVKMIQASKKYCFMSGFVYRNSKISDELSKQEFGQGYRGKKKAGESIYCAFNILWNMGFCPEIIYKDTVWENEWALDKVIEDYTSDFCKTGYVDKESEEKVKKYLESISEDGKVKDVTRSKIAWILWEV